MDPSNPIFQSAISKYVESKGGFEFYGNSVDPATSFLSKDGLIVLRKKRSSETVAEYRVDELGLSREEINKWLPLNTMQIRPDVVPGGPLPTPPPLPPPLTQDKMASETSSEYALRPSPASQGDPAEGSTACCPFCGEEIRAIAKKCKHCGEFIDPVMLKLMASSGQSTPPRIHLANEMPVYSICGGLARLGRTKAILMIREFSLDKLEIAFREDEYSFLDDELKVELSNRYSVMTSRLDSERIRAVSKPAKRKSTAVLLALLLGGLGIHKFYLGKFEQGILYLLFCWTYIPGIIGLVEGLVWLFMSEEEWQKSIAK